MHASGLKCWSCDWHGPLEMRYECPICGDSLEVSYNYDKVDRSRIETALQRLIGLWDFQELLPVKEKSSIISMNEGATPLYQAREKMGCRAYWKDETRNPTLSFKDRPNTTGISAAKELGYCEVSTASTGNGGASLAAYAAKAGMKCHICIPESTPIGKMVQAKFHGAELTLCVGDYSDSYGINYEQSKKNRWANITSTYLNPYTMEGDKTIAYEIFAQMERKVPDWISVPLGAGAMLTGIYKGFTELKTLGFCDRLPKMIGVQAEGCAPIADAWLEKWDQVRVWQQCTTIAGAIADPLKGYEKDGTRTLHTIYRSGGVAVKVSDLEMISWVRRLAEREGMFVEPASASAAAAIEKLAADQIIGKNDVVVGIITAHGLKDCGESDNYI
jgi:threonine synthase|nr:threonine synthase [uncultured Schaedlerella sp.]